MFGLFESSVKRGNVQASAIERRLLCFGPEKTSSAINKFGSENLSNRIEIKVFRSKGRQRVHHDLQEYQTEPGTLHVDKKGVRQLAKGNLK